MVFKLVLATSLIIFLCFCEVQTASISPYPSRPQYQSVVRELFPYIKIDRLKSFIQKFSSFHDRHYENENSGAERWLDQEIRTTLSLYNAGPTYFRKIGDPPPSVYPQNNFIAKLEGQDPKSGSELVILGAHYDTFNDFGGDPTPGADDNATGCAVLLEILRLAVKFGIKFKRTVEFHWYTAKEQDRLYGSADVVKTYREEHLIHIGSVRMLNLDTLGHQEYDFDKRIGVVDSCPTWNGWRTTDNFLTHYVQNLVGWYVNRGYTLKDASERRRCISDNYSWHQEGYSAAAVMAYDFNGYVHREKDTVDRVNFEQVKEYAKLALAFVIELGELHENLVVTEPPPPSEPVTTEEPEMTTDEEGMSTTTDSSGLELGSEDPDESFAVKPEGGWTMLGACLVGIWLLH